MEARDGVQCTLCLKQYDFPCAGITEIGFRKLGDRKATWKCNTCKNTSSGNPAPGRSNFCTPCDLDGIRGELRGLSEQMSSLPKLLDSVKNIQADLADLKTIKSVRAENTAITDQDDDATTSSSTVSKTKNRKYDESYISFGFVDSNGSPLCMLCSKLLPNSSMAAAKLRRHLETVHPESKDKDKEFFVRKKEQLLESPKNMMHVTQTIYEKAKEASYLVSYRIAQAGEAHNIAENLIKPCVLDITKCMLDEKSAKHLSTVPLSNNTVSRRIHDLASYVKQELVARLQKTRFALQMDESTDVTGLAILLVIVRYPYERSFEEDMLMCLPLPTNTTGEEIFNKINIFFKENNLSWNDCVDICTDGAKAMTGKTAGAVSGIKNKAPNCSSSHCILR
ncbi:unnamed protein product [Parnassius apollo]|uniref:(apollo) hypothetical protein n=1 Tax=Parnassius apollo TaxID=110799 RepID=A0A8S3XUQ6_PARAO|nr:unnamed protein product [Parnassius apollo]